MTMKFTEALLLGSMTTKQGYGSRAWDPSTSNLCATETVALTAGLASLRKIEMGYYYLKLRQAYPFLSEYMDNSDTAVSVLERIWFYNDTLHKTRPWIAEWVRPIEEKWLAEHASAGVVEPMEESSQLQEEGKDYVYTQVE